AQSRPRIAFRLTSDGATDATFAGQGTLSIPSPLTEAAVGPDGFFYAFEKLDNGNDVEWRPLRFSPTGDADPTFVAEPGTPGRLLVGSHGLVTTSTTTQDL